MGINANADTSNIAYEPRCVQPCAYYRRSCRLTLPDSVLASSRLAFTASRCIPTLLDLYKSTLSTLQTRIPQGVVYRQSAEAITQHRVGIIEKHAGSDGSQGGEQAVEGIEKELDLGRIEEVIKMAEGEKSLVEKMSEWKSWEDLQHKPEKGQWEYFAVPASTSLPSTE